MVAKSKTTTPKTKGTVKATKPKKDEKSELVPKFAKKSQKTAQKRTKNLTKPKKPVITDAMFEAYFLKQSASQFQALAAMWNEKNLKIKLTKQQDYDSWLNYFKTVPARKLQILSTTGMDILDAEAYSALLRWRDIIANPHRIDKIHQAGLTNASGDKKKKTIAQLALENDRLGVLMATRDKIAEKLDKGAGSRDTALLTREMTEIMTQIADYEKRLGPKKETKLGQLMGDMPDVKRKRPSENGKGADHMSFRSRVTIEDVEG
jgi:hypothetical protein